MPLILGWLRMAGTRRLNGSGLILIRAAVWIFLPPVTLVSVSMLFVGVLGACVVTWRLSDRMLSLTAFMMLPDIFVGLTRMLLVSLPLPVRKQTLACGATFSPAALGGRMPHRPSTMCVWDGCTELGAFDHIAWECPRRPCNIPKPAEFLSSRYGWVVTNQVCDIDAVHGWLVHVHETLWSLRCPSMTCACLYHGPSYLPVFWSCPLALPLGLPCLRGLPLWVWLVCLGLCPLVSFLRRWLVFRWAVCTFGVVWAPCPPDAMDCSRWAFAFGVHGVLSWWATAAAALAAPLALRCLFGGSSDQSSHIKCPCRGVLRQSAIERT